MIDSGLRARMAVGPPALGYAVAWAALAALAVVHARETPTAHLWAAIGLGAALLLDAGARLAGRAAGAPPAVGMPSLVFGVGEAAGLALGFVALAALPAAFPVLASGLAGLLAIGATARLVLALTLLRLAREPAQDQDEPWRPPPLGPARASPRRHRRRGS